jgi:hypothetical protein
MMSGARVLGLLGSVVFSLGCWFGIYEGIRAIFW